MSSAVTGAPWQRGRADLCLGCPAEQHRSLCSVLRPMWALTGTGGWGAWCQYVPELQSGATLLLAEAFQNWCPIWLVDYPSEFSPKHSTVKDRNG